MNVQAQFWLIAKTWCTIKQKIENILSAWNFHIILQNNLKIVFAIFNQILIFHQMIAL